MIPRVKTSDGLPPSVREMLVILGGQIRLARRRREITQEEMATRMFITRKTLSRLEHGDPGVSLAVLASALWVLGLDQSLRSLAAPESDTVGRLRDRQRTPTRVRHPAQDDKLDF